MSNGGLTLRSRAHGRRLTRDVHDRRFASSRAKPPRRWRRRFQRHEIYRSSSEHRVARLNFT
jgi:hypothetical protein